MKHTLRFLGLCAAFAVVPMLGACSSTDTNNKDEGSGTGGSTSTSTNTNTNTDKCKPTVLYNFNNTLQGFKLSDVVGTAPYVNLNAPGTTTLAGDPPLLQWASEDYDGNAPTPGAMKISATFSDWNQNVSPEVNGPSDSNNNPVDLSHMILHAQVYLQKGLSPNSSAPGGIVFYVKSGSTYAWGSAPWTNLTTGGWLDVTFDTDNPDSGSSIDFNAALPVQLGFQLSSGGGGTVGPFGATPLQTVVFIDQVTMVPNTCK